MRVKGNNCKYSEINQVQTLNIFQIEIYYKLIYNFFFLQFTYKNDIYPLSM
jgi:hypothetical protein